MKIERTRSLLRYEDSSSFISLQLTELKERLFRKLTRESANVFLRSGDLISIPPQVSGVWEPDLTRFIERCANNGYGDFLIDIGANIGLTSCQNGGGFNQVHMFEPNPLCVHILEVNSAISLERGRYQIHPVGLGKKDEEQTLSVPKHNWGGAFINSRSNTYSNEILSQKDGFESLDESNYDEVRIEVRNASQVLRKLFGELGSSGLTSGVIKIDVEGYEFVVLEGIAKSIPDDFNAVIVFENWSEDYKFEPLLQMLDGRGSGYVLDSQPPWKTSWPKWLRAISLLWDSKYVTRLTSLEDAESVVGDIVIIID